MFSSSKPTSIDAVKCAVVIAFSLATVMPIPASAQYCAEYIDELLDTTDDCVNEPWRERASDVETFSKNGNNYVVINRGNELSIHNINNPRATSNEDSSSFNFGTRGDSDYDLMDFDVCDGCRYGVLAHKLERTVIFDLGAGAPDFGAHQSYDAAESVAGGYLFLKGGQHYLIAAGLADDGCLGSALYEVYTPSNISKLECLEVGGSALTVKGLHSITGTGDVLYLYAGALNGQTHVFRADGGVASPLTLAYMSSPSGMFGRRYELAIDGKNRLAASADYTGGVVRVWDLDSPDDPVLLYNIPGTAGSVSLESAAPGSPSTLMTTTPGWANSTRTYIIEDTGYDDVVDELFWTDTSLPHNNLPGCGFATGGALSPDGSALYLSRYAIHQYYDFTECLTPTPPFAQIAITPSEPFPYDIVTVRDISTGRVDSWALWITDGPDPDDPDRVAGNRGLSDSNPRTITFRIPSALLDSNDYWAHVELQSDDFPPGPNDSTSVHIDVDRRPTVTISVDPDTVIVTESVDLSAAVNGGTPDSYEWEIRAPGVASGDGDIYYDQEVNSLSLDVSGTWIFDVTARYDHEDPDGPALYEATASYNQTVSSVAANFNISPATPLHNQVITLNGSSSQPIGGNLGFSWDIQEEGGPGSYDDCPSAAVCTIPAETLEMETAYHVTLTVTNEDVPGDPPSSKMIRMYVGNGDVNPSITFSPSNPERGENVTFHIEGVPPELDRATWALGGTGCDGASSSQVCEPSLFNDCKALSFKYSSSGTKTVRLTIEIDDVTYPEVTVSVPVAASGSCDVLPGECEYNLGRSSVEFGPSGGESAVTVNTTAGCDWTAATATPWITILAPTGSVSGTGTLRFRVPENFGPYRGGSINAGGETLAVYQQAPWVAANFTMSNPQPEIGEVVTVTVDPILEVVSWDFGQVDCRDNDPQISCLFLPSGACNTFQWTFPTAGEKEITMVLSDGRTQTKNPTVVPVGECCLADGRPDADFAMSTNEAYTGETIAFTDLSSKAALAHAKALGFSWSPTNPEIGENVLFSLEGVVGDVASATWSLGGDGCDGASSTKVCEASLFNDCKAMSFKYASAGAKSVSVSVELESGGTESVGPHTVTVANAGSCDSGSGGGCSYALSSTTQSFASTGGTGSFNVTTSAECEWTATTSSSWVDITSDSGIGSGTVNYNVDLNPYTANRAATIQVEGKNHRVSQAGDAGDTAPDEWRWTITRVEDDEGLAMDEDVHTSSDPNTSFTFRAPGRYRVVLTAINCYGSDTRVSYVEIEESPVENFVVAAAISSGGANGTRWESDFRFFNPCDDALDVSLVYQPDNVDNSAKLLSSYPFSLGPNETMVFPNVREVVEAEEEEAINGSILIDSVSASGCKVLSVSRTFNDTPDGTLGLFVPAMPVTSTGVETLNLTGLISNNAYRSNLRLVNHGDTEAWVKITVFHKSGEALNTGKSVRVKSHSTKQLNDVAGWAGVEGALSQFTVLAEVKTEGAIVDGFGTVIDNISGDSVMNSSSYLDEPVIWLPGVVHAPGKNDTLWQTDIWFHNPDPTNDWLASQATYLHGKNVDNNYVFDYPGDWPAVEAMGMRRRLDIAGSILDNLALESTSGYMIFEGLDQANAPQISARTYTSDDNGGTYGLHLPSFGPKDLLQVGEVGYIVGVSNSADDLTGFRTNLGLLATDRTAEVEVTFFYPDGTQAPEPWITTVWAGQSKQINNVFGKFGLGNETVTGTFKIEVLSGGEIIIYATEIDNKIGDSIFVPAQQKYMGLAR